MVSKNGCAKSIEQERTELREMILSALAENTVPAIQHAQRCLREWLRRYPEDYVMWEAGEPLALTEDALLMTNPEPITVEVAG